MLLYLARLKVISGGTARFFDTPEDVWHWLEMWEKVPKERQSAGRTGVRGLILRVSNGCGMGDIPGTVTQQSPVRFEDGRVEIQADGTTAMSASVQCGEANAPSLMNEEMAIQKESGADEYMV
ncbi:hypothetical protein NDU88_002350 [Pleurodeles waltl]|uniref:Uncharacterized protein n=1 Tax=Pleurodeles waltl TaxID=8319 RepID=A0AAV7Q5Q2_PLEWA|nr:hypothetical protein NDU88_002350 [Pleurodeles waltl]